MLAGTAVQRVCHIAHLGCVQALFVGGGSIIHASGCCLIGSL